VDLACCQVWTRACLRLAAAQVRLCGLMQGGFKRLNQFVRQVADETHGVGQGSRALFVAEPQRTRGGVQRGKKLIGREGTGLDEAVEQGRLARIGVADQRDAKTATPLTGLALGAALALDLFQTCLHGLDAVADHAAVQFDLCFARATTGADATLLALQVAPAADEPGGHVLQPRQFNLQLAFVALRPLLRRCPESGRCGRPPARQDAAPGCAVARGSGTDQKSRRGPLWRRPVP
jgi:hypothetical protein